MRTKLIPMGDDRGIRIPATHGASNKSSPGMQIVRMPGENVERSEGYSSSCST